MKKIISVLLAIICLFSFGTEIIYAETLMNNVRVKIGVPYDAKIGNKNMRNDEIVYDSYTFRTKKDYMYFFWIDQMSGLQDLYIDLYISRGGFSSADNVTENYSYSDYVYYSPVYPYKYNSVYYFGSIKESDITIFIEPYYLSSCPYSVYVEEYPLGDVDFDGKVTTADARLTLRAAIGLESYSELETWEDLKHLALCNVTGDDVIATDDARLILRAAIGLDVLSYG